MVHEGWRAFFDKLKQKYLVLTQRGVPSLNPGVCAIGVLSDQILMVIQENRHSGHIDRLISCPLTQKKDFAAVLKQTVAEYGLQGMDCHWILNPSQYHLFLMDNLPVEDSEFQSAVRWKLMELIPFPTEEALIDRFSIPAQRTHDPHPMMMIAVTRAETLKTDVDVILDAGLNLSTIGIRELALRNIAALFEKDKRSAALIYLEDTSSEVLIVRLGQLYLHRHFTVGWQQLAGALVQASEEGHPICDDFVLELQRSFDYYQSQWRHALPSEIILVTASAAADSAGMAALLTARLAVSVRPLKLEEVVSIRQPLSPEEQGKYLSLVGSIVQKDGLNHATEH